MNLRPLERLEKDVRRSGEIVAVLAKYGLADWLKGLDLPWVRERLHGLDGRGLAGLGTAERARLALSELGPTFIKLGQMLSTRPDLVGPEAARELARLQTDAPADPPSQVHAAIRAELGKSPAKLFAHFKDEPLASASIAQVHAARLHSGEHVVVKIQHAGIVDKILPDLDILDGLAGLAQAHSAQARLYQPEEVLRQFRRTLLRELDFEFELRNLEEFARNFAGDETVRFPKAWPELSTRRVLTMERLDGVLGNHPKALRHSGADLDQFARRGADMYMRMIFRDSFYHADPHPGNLMLLPGGVVGVLDCGMVGRFDEELAEQLGDLIGAVVRRSSSELEEVILRFGAAAAVPRERLRADLADFVADFAGQSLAGMDIARLLQSLFEIVRRYGIALPPPLTMLLRTLIELEGTAQALSPRFSLAEVLGPFYDSMTSTRTSPRRLLGRLGRDVRDWERLLHTLPRDIDEALQRARQGKFRVHLDHRRLDPVVNRLAVGLVTAASILGAASLLASFVLALGLLRSIRKSGGLSPED